jgi:flagellar basal body P-ring protein FlgI
MSLSSAGLSRFKPNNSQRRFAALFFLVLTAAIAIIWPGQGKASSRIKDIASFEGIRGN